MEQNSFQLIHLELGELGTNCYLLISSMPGKEKAEAVIIDPAASENRISAALDRAGAVPVAILLTHGHYDHFGAVDALREQYRIPVYAMETEKELLGDPYANLSMSFSNRAMTTTADHFLSDGQKLELAGMELEVIATPGHTPGGCCFYLAEEGYLFSGDTLFYGSVGRTDFPGGDMEQLRESIRSRLFILPPKTRVFSGHGSPTTIEFEMRHNPFVS